MWQDYFFVSRSALLLSAVHVITGYVGLLMQAGKLSAQLCWQCTLAQPNSCTVERTGTWCQIWLLVCCLTFPIICSVFQTVHIWPEDEYLLASSNVLWLSVSCQGSSHGNFQQNEARLACPSCSLVPHTVVKSGPQLMQPLSSFGKSSLCSTPSLPCLPRQEHCGHLLGAICNLVA